MSLDLIAGGGRGNQRDDGVTTGTVSGKGTKIALEVFAMGVTTSLYGFQIKFDFDVSLLAFRTAEANENLKQLADTSMDASFGGIPPVTLAPSGLLVRTEFETLADVTGREFSIGIESVPFAESSASQDELTTTSEISFNVTPSPDFDGDGTVGFSDFLIFAGAFGSQVPPSGCDGGGEVPQRGIGQYSGEQLQRKRTYKWRALEFQGYKK